jgi:hypothetical protein
MTNPETYRWQSVCVRAISETDNSLTTARIYEALSAIEQRRLSPVEKNSDEDCALNDVEVRIKALITERTDKLVWDATPGHWTIGL